MSAGGGAGTGARADGRPRVVIVGAGFGGLWTARELAGAPVDVVLVDRNNFHTFLPLLYQVAAAELESTEIVHPVRSIVRRHRNVRFVMGAVERLDLDARTAWVGDRPLAYDYLVLATGSTTHYFGVEGAEEHAFPLKVLEEGIGLRNHILARFEAAAREGDGGRRRRALTFTIVGGGPTGVEFAGALAELVHGPLERDYPDVAPDEVRVVLLEAKDRLLPGGFPEKLGRYAARRLGRMGIDVRTGAMVARIGPHVVELDDGTSLDTDTVVWTAGVRGDPLAEEWGLPVGRGGRVQVEPTLRVPSRPGVYVVGDLAYVESEGEPVPQVAPAATQMGEHAARSILGQVAGEEPGPFRFRDPGMLATIGRNAGVANVFGRAFTGFAAWVLWLAVHIVKLIGFRNRIVVLVNWAWDYFAYERVARLILPMEPVKGRASGLLPTGFDAAEGAGGGGRSEPAPREPPSE